MRIVSHTAAALSLLLWGPVVALAAPEPGDASNEERPADPESSPEPEGTSEPDVAPQAEGPRLPSAERIVPAVHPAQQLADGIASRVVLELTIDADGRVDEASIAQSGGPDFDEAVLAVAPSWRFTPALDARGRAVSARIQFAYDFDLDAAPPVSLTGRAREAGTREPLPDARVVLRGPDGATVELRAARDGTFSAAGLQPGAWEVQIDRPGFDPSTAQVQILDGKVTEVTLYAVRGRPWEAEAAQDTIEVVGRAVSPEVTERVLSAEELRYLPGSNGDVIKGIQNLPGLARPPLGIGQLIVRGTSPEDSAYYVDGIGIPLAFHFGGLATVLPSDSIEEVAFLPGNFGVRYGRVIGGTLDIRTTSTLPERSGGNVSIDLFQASVFVQQRIGERTALTLSGRRSYIDGVLNPILNGMEGVNIRAPRYYDVQARLQHELESGGTLDALFLLSDDRFRVVGGEEGESTVGLTQAFRKARLRWIQPLGSGWRNELAVGVGPSFQTFEFGGAGQAEERDWSVDLRQELYKPAGDEGVGWRMGLDVRTDQAQFLYDVPGFGATEPEQGSGWRLRPSAYLEPTVRVGRFQLVPGVRADGHVVGPHQAWWIDPRFSGTARLGPTTKVKLAVGRYSQPPLVRQVLEGGGGNPDLRPFSSLQTGIGIEQQIAPGVSVEVNRFYNWLLNTIVGRDDAFRFFTGPPPVGPFDTESWANEGSGRIAGIETIFKAQTSRLTALASATISRSVRIDRKGDEALFAYDQPVIVNALASYKLSRGWRLGGRVRVASGNPYTPVVNRIFDHESRGFLPVYGERDSARLPPFWSIDVRVDKEWVFDKWTLAFYLDLQNATNRANVEVMAWTYDYRAEEPITSLPILPAFGLRADW